jgi:hypothetical protein
MKIRLPITFDLPVDAERLENLLIDHGVAVQKHDREAEAAGPLNATDQMIAAFLEREESRKRLWSFLDETLDLPNDAPIRLKDLLILSLLCGLFAVEVNVRSIVLEAVGSVRGCWKIEVQLTDSKGRFRGNGISVSSSFDPSDHAASLTAFFGTIADAFRESARRVFAMSELYDDQDVR